MEQDGGLCPGLLGMESPMGMTHLETLLAPPLCVWPSQGKKDPKDHSDPWKCQHSIKEASTGLQAPGCLHSC